jgi:leucyl aminopeptidase
VGVYEDGDLGVAAGRIDAQLDGLLASCTRMGISPASSATCCCCRRRRGGRGAGAADRPGHAQRSAASNTARPCIHRSGAGQDRRADAVVYLALENRSPTSTCTTARAVAEVFCAQLYKIPDLKTSAKPKAPRLTSVSVAVADARAAKAAAEGLRIGAAVGSGLTLSRDLANLPPNICTPTYLGTRAQALAKEFPSIKTKVLDESAIKALKMGAFLAVTQGSDQPPRLIVCEYRGGKKNAAPVCLIGKGITFDSGGIS